MADVAPYVDFGIWGPNHHRLLRRMRLQGLQLHGDGTLHSVELDGPPDLQAWMRSYRLLLSGLLGFGAVAVSNLLDYVEKVREYHDRYGPSTWALLYQADVRCRQEHMERARRTLERNLAEATVVGRSPAQAFDPARPGTTSSGAASSRNRPSWSCRGAAACRTWSQGTLRRATTLPSRRGR